MKIAFLAIWAILAYIGVAGLFYGIMIKCDPSTYEDDTYIAMCLLWPLTLITMVVGLPIILAALFLDWVGNQVKNGKGKDDESL